MSDAGINSYRGYKAQTFITLFEAFNLKEADEWIRFTLEPKDEDNIVDITFEYPNYTCFYQVKSSKNKFSETTTIELLKKLKTNKNHKSGDKVKVVLVGEADFKHNEIDIVPLDLDKMIHDLASLLNEYITNEFPDTLDKRGLDILASSLTTRVEIFTIAQRITFDRGSFKEAIAYIMGGIIKDKEVDLEHLPNLRNFVAWLRMIIAIYEIELDDDNPYSVGTLRIADNASFKFDDAYQLIKVVANDTTLWVKFKDTYNSLKSMNEILNDHVFLIEDTSGFGREPDTRKLKALKDSHTKFKGYLKCHITKAKEFEAWITKVF